jgi:hypothetical protein
MLLNSFEKQEEVVAVEVVEVMACASSYSTRFISSA